MLSRFGRVYAAYGGIFIVFSILWGVLIDKKKPDRYEIIGSFIVLVGAVIIYYAPRNG
jgi:small multidrug resistance family-3 protein